MKLKKSVLIIFLSIMIFSLVGCGKSTKKEDNNVSSENNITKDEEKNSEDNVIEEEQTEVVVSTSVALTEILDALGIKVSGVPSTSYELPESTKDAVEVGNPMSPDLEIIKSLNPDVVISIDTLGSDYIKLFQENNILSEFVSLSSLDGLKETIKTLGERFNKNEKAEKLISEIEKKEESVSNFSESADILILFAAPGSTMIATPASYIGSLVELVGGHNLVQDSSMPFVTYNKEELTKLNPEKILVMIHAMPEETKKALEKEMASDAAWQSINAVKEGKVIYLDSNYFGMSANLKVIEGLDILKDIVHNEE